MQGYSNPKSVRQSKSKMNCRLRRPPWHRFTAWLRLPASANMAAPLVGNELDQDSRRSPMNAAEKPTNIAIKVRVTFSSAK
jgi:hypothetical protein